MMIYVVSFLTKQEEIVTVTWPGSFWVNLMIFFFSKNLLTLQQNFPQQKLKKEGQSVGEKTIKPIMILLGQNQIILIFLVLLYPL